MKQVVQIPRTGEIQVLDVPPPRLRPGGALILTHASVISPGTERSKVGLGKASLVGKARARPDLARQVVERARRAPPGKLHDKLHSASNANDASDESGPGAISLD
jgi:hypothetical protein